MGRQLAGVALTENDAETSRSAQAIGLRIWPPSRPQNTDASRLSPAGVEHSETAKMTLPLDESSSKNSHTAEAEDLASDTAQKGKRRARAKQLPASPTAHEDPASDPPPALDDRARDLTKVQNALEIAELNASLENDDNARCGYDIGATLTLVPPEGIALIAPANSVQFATPDAATTDGVQLASDAPRALMFDPPITPATPVLEAALQLARAGFRVVWCWPRQKRPIMTSWPKRATSDPIEIDDQYARLPLKKGETPNVGIACGECDLGFVVAVDVDDAARFAQLEAEHGGLPPTLTGRSPKGARLFFLIPPGARTDLILRNLVGIGGMKGVDLRVAGGQVVVGPSVHPDLSATGELQHYTWDAEQLPLATLPDTWVRAVTEPIAIPKWVAAYTPQSMKADAKAHKRAEKYLEKAVCGEAVRVAGCGEGRRNSTLHDALCNVLPLAVGLMLHNGQMYAERELASAARSAGLSQREINTTITSVQKWMRDTGASRVPAALATERARLTLVRIAPAGDAAYAEREAIEREEQQLDEWDGHSPMALESEAGPRVRVAGLTLDGKGYPTKTAGNVAIMLADYPGGPPRYNEFHDVVTWPDGRTYDDARDLVDVENWLLAHPEAIVRAKPDAIDKGIAYAARKRSFHPVRDYLRSLTWDGTPRVERLFAGYFGAMHSAYTAGASRCFMVGAVARIMRPGCKLDTMPVLEGAQGIGKSRALRILAGEWFSDSTITDKSPDCFQALRGVWIYELAELASVSGRESERIKAYVSSAVDRYRTSYARRVADVPRQVAFAGTTNAHAYLSDSTGARRFHPIACGLIDLEALARDRDQLWAEAVVMLERGEAWHLSPDLEVQQRGIAVAREHEDSWTEAVAGWTVTGATVTIQRGLSLLLIDVGKQTKADAMRLALLLTKQGWSKGRQTLNGQRIVLWTPPLTA
jgi:hypothetical protein